MRLTIKYLGMLAEVTNCEQETLEFSKSVVSELIEELINKDPELSNREFKVAQDLEIISNECTINANEIALLPPFSGG